MIETMPAPPEVLAGFVHREKIRFLLDNPHLAQQVFNKTQTSNCWGTAIWILSLEKKVEECWQRACAGKREIEADGTGSYISFPHENTRPGYIGARPMEVFLENAPYLIPVSQERALQGIFTTWYENMNAELCGFQIRHAAIHLRDGILFHQSELGEYGGIFEFSTIDKELSKIPPQGKSSLQVRFYQTATMESAK